MILKVELKFLASSGSIFWAMKQDFLQLMTIPEALQKILKRVCNEYHSSKFASPGMRTSSTNNKCEIKVSTTTFIHLKDPFETAFFICLLRHSITRRNKRGERGHPCLKHQ